MLLNPSHHRVGLTPPVCSLLTEMYHICGEITSVTRRGIQTSRTPLVALGHAVDDTGLALSPIPDLRCALQPPFETRQVMERFRIFPVQGQVDQLIKPGEYPLYL